MGNKERRSQAAVLGKRAREGTSPQKCSPLAMEAQHDPVKRPKIPRGGKRGAALLLAAGVNIAKDSAAEQSNPVPKAPAKSHRVALVGPSRITTRKQSSIALPAAGDPLLRQALPTKLQSLKDLFMAIQTVYEMLRRRGRRTTFTNLKAAVEEASGRRFSESHLQQLHTLLPDCFILETVTLPVAPNSIRTAKHTLFTLLPEAAELTTGARCALLHARLAQHLLDAYAAHLRTSARERHAAGEPLEASELEKAAQQPPPIVNFMAPFPEGVPEIGSTQGPLSSGSGGTGTALSSPRPVSSCARVTFSSSPSAAPSVGQQASTPAPAAAAPAPLLPLANQHLRTRRLSFSTATAISKHAILNAVQKDDAAILESVPEELRRRSLDGIISLDALRVLEGNEAVHRRYSTQEARAAREISAALGELPKNFSRLRRIFGSRGPSAMKLEEVVRKIRQGGAEMTSDAQVVAGLRALAENAPEFVQLKPWGGCGTPAVWINRQCDMNGVGGRLRAVAEGRLKVEQGGEAQA